MHDLQKLKKQKNIFFAFFSRLLRSSRTNAFQLFQRPLSVEISHFRPLHPLVRYKKIAPAFSIYRPSMDITAHPCATTGS
jgi:hypothetical protein